MAYVKLPNAIARLRSAMPGPKGDTPPVILRVFAGEVSGGGGSVGGRRLMIRSPRSEQSFQFDALPLRFSPGQLAGVALVTRDRNEAGEVIAAANLDEDRKVEFIGHEARILERLSGRTRRERRRRASTRVAAGVLFKTMLITGLGYGGAMGLDILRLTEAGATIPPVPFSAIEVAFGAAALAVVYFTLTGVARLRRLARSERRLLDGIWRNAGEALGFVQDHGDAFRLSPTQRALPSLARMERDSAQREAADLRPARPRRPRLEGGINLNRAR